MAKTAYEHVYTDAKGSIYYELSLGTDLITGKRIRKKGRRDENGKPFTTPKEAYIEALRIKSEYLQGSGYSNYDLGFKEFMGIYYVPYYQTEVKLATFEARQPIFKIIIERFGGKKLRNITRHDVEAFRVYLLSPIGAGYSQMYASQVFGTFRRIMTFAYDRQYLDKDVSNEVEPIPKGRADINYWTKTDFEAVLSCIDTSNLYEHLCFVIIWVYFMTGVRVNEGTALYWRDVDFEEHRLKVHHMLIIKNKDNWHRQTHTKTNDGKRTISLDDDTINVMRKWRRTQKQAGIDTEFIFSYDGKPMIKSTLGRIVKRYAKLAGVPEIQVKGLRHSHASYLINEFNCSVLILSKRLGHSSSEITLKHYAHLWSGLDDSIAQEMTKNIHWTKPNKSLVEFNGNQEVSPKMSPKPVGDNTKA